jgi:hypothetical protein
VVGAIHLVATWADEELLLDHLGEPGLTQLRDWPEIDLDAEPLSRPDRAGRTRLALLDPAVWPPPLVAVPGTVPDVDTLPPIGFLARHRRTAPPPPAPGSRSGWLDPEHAAFLLWERREQADGLVVAALGSQAERLETVGTAHARRVQRVQSWVRRRGERVWGLEQHALRPDLHLHLDHVSSVWALPGALAALEAGARVPG